MENIFPNRRWLVIPTSITGSIDYNQVLESTTTTFRLSVDGSKTFVKYDVNEVTASYTQSIIIADTGETGSYVVEAGVYGRPSSVYSPEYPEYNYIEMTELMATPEWTNPISSLE